MRFWIDDFMACRERVRKGRIRERLDRRAKKKSEEDMLDEYEEMAKALERHKGLLTPWEERLVTKIIATMREGGHLTPNRIELLTEIHDRVVGPL